jgi:hypothetical protein
MFVVRLMMRLTNVSHSIFKLHIPWRVNRLVDSVPLVGNFVHFEVKIMVLLLLKSRLQLPSGWWQWVVPITFDHFNFLTASVEILAHWCRWVYCVKVFLSVMHFFEHFHLSCFHFQLIHSDRIVIHIVASVEICDIFQVCLIFQKFINDWLGAVREDT